MRVPSLAWCAAASLAALVLAGCSAKGPSAAAPEPETGLVADLGAPTWAVRDYWTYETPMGRSTYVVTGETGTDWIVGTTSTDLAFFDAREDVSRLGEVGKADLAGSQLGDRVQFFRFPLRHGDTWATTWDQTPVSVVALDAGGGLWEFYANRSDGVPLYTYAYDGDVGWFHHLAHHDANGTEDYRISFVERGHGFTGTTYRYLLRELDAATGAAPVTHNGRFDVGEGVTDLWLDLRLECTGSAGYTYLLHPLNPPGPPAVQESSQCTSHEHTGPMVESPARGTWQSVLSAGGASVSYTYVLLERTLEEVPVGDAVTPSAPPGTR